VTGTLLLRAMPALSVFIAYFAQCGKLPQAQALFVLRIRLGTIGGDMATPKKNSRKRSLVFLPTAFPWNIATVGLLHAFSQQSAN